VYDEEEEVHYIFGGNPGGKEGKEGRLRYLYAYAQSYTAKTQYVTKNLKKIFPEKLLRGLNPNSYIHVSVCDLYVSPIGLSILLQENRWTDRRNI
jgi:hypothetical protein